MQTLATANMNPAVSFTDFNRLNIVKSTKRKWEEKNGIYFLPPITVSGCKTAKEFYKHYNDEGVLGSESAKRIILSKDYVITPQNTVIRPVIIPGGIFEHRFCLTPNILKKARSLNCKLPNADLSCLILDIYKDKEIMQLELDHIIPMHKPIELNDGTKNYLGIDTSDITLEGYLYDYENGWEARDGFVFVL